MRNQYIKIFFKSDLWVVSITLFGTAFFYAIKSPLIWIPLALLVLFAIAYTWTMIRPKRSESISNEEFEAQIGRRLSIYLVLISVITLVLFGLSKQ
jgi:hypothetical protein